MTSFHIKNIGLQTQVIPPFLVNNKLMLLLRRACRDISSSCIRTANCCNICLSGRPNYHNKDAPVKNLKLLQFASVQDVVIDNRGNLKNWINEASDEKYWNALVKCLLDKNATSSIRRSDRLVGLRRGPTGARQNALV